MMCLIAPSNAGASSKEPVTDKFWGDRVGSLTDPFGHRWMILRTSRTFRQMK
jgi:uncharacterized glyoxalase superfamily protein PhnB